MKQRHIRLRITDKRLARQPQVHRWLRRCEERMNTPEVLEKVTSKYVDLMALGVSR